MTSFLVAVGVGMIIMAMVSADDGQVHSWVDAGLHPQPEDRFPVPPHPSDSHDRLKRQTCGTPTLLTADQQTETLNQHNLDRSLEPSSNENLLSWDVNLAAIAQQYASQCTWKHGMLNDCLGNPVGQNLYMVSSSGSSFPTLSMTNAVAAWYRERQYWNYTSSTCQPNQVCGHFTQLVWATTTSVGCGYAMCPTVYVPGGTNVTNGVIVVCDYSPAGNVVGVQPFITGTACANCPIRTSTTNPGYTCTNGLCAACNPASDPTCQCGPADSCSGHGTWQTTSCSCQCDASYYGSSCQYFCADADGYTPSCLSWKATYCNNPPYYNFMQTNCAKTCGYCS